MECWLHYYTRKIQNLVDWPNTASLWLQQWQIILFAMIQPIRVPNWILNSTMCSSCCILVYYISSENNIPWGNWFRGASRRKHLLYSDHFSYTWVFLHLSFHEAYTQKMSYKKTRFMLTDSYKQTNASYPDCTYSCICKASFTNHVSILHRCFMELPFDVQEDGSVDGMLEGSLRALLL